jgi:5-methyltetrahydropteroyltriglutamate--homocysteine methyltransferase
MLETTIAGSLPKPAWLATPRTLWAPWRVEAPALEEAKRDAVRLALRDQERAGIDIVTDGEQSRRHFVWGFVESLDGVDFSRMVTVGIRADRYKADVPTVTAPVRRRGPIHAAEVRFARSQTDRRLKFTMPGPMTIADTIHDAHYGSRAKLGMALARLINEEARELEALGVDMIQLDEPAFNVYMDEVRDWGLAALDAAVEGLRCRTAVHICYGYGIKANTDWKQTLGGEWRQYEQTFPLLARSRIGGVSLECAASRVPISLIGLLGDKDILLGAVDVASDAVETPEEVARVIRAGLAHVPPARIFPCTNCGMVPLDRAVALGKLHALAAGAAIVRKERGA